MVNSLFYKIANVVAFLGLGYNSYSGLVDKDRSPYHNSHNTYLTPSSCIYSVWGLIHALLFGFVIYQFFPAATEIVADGIGWHFLAISFWNFIWLLAYQANHEILAIIPILILSGQVSYIYYKINKYPHNLGETLWIRAPFSLYHGWIFALTILSLFVAFSQEKKEGDDDKGPTLLTKILVFFGLSFLKTTAYVYSRFKDDIGGAIVIAIFIYGIAVEQKDAFIHWSAIVFAVLTTFLILKPIVVGLIRRLRSTPEEREQIFP